MSSVLDLNQHPMPTSQSSPASSTACLLRKQPQRRPPQTPANSTVANSPQLPHRARMHLSRSPPAQSLLGTKLSLSAQLRQPARPSHPPQALELPPALQPARPQARLTDQVRHWIQDLHPNLIQALDQVPTPRAGTVAQPVTRHHHAVVATHIGLHHSCQGGLNHHECR